MKSFKILLALLAMFCIGFTTVTPVYAEDLTTISDDYGNIGDNFCDEPGVLNVARFAGWAILMMKIFVPLIVIGRGMFIFFNAVVSDSDKDLKKSAIEFGKKVAFGLLVFFVPTLFDAMFSLFANFGSIEEEYGKCEACLLKPADCNPGSPLGSASDSGSGDNVAPNCATVDFKDCSKYTNCEVKAPSGSSTPTCGQKSTYADNCATIDYKDCTKYTNCKVIPPTGNSTPSCGAK